MYSFLHSSGFNRNSKFTVKESVVKKRFIDVLFGESCLYLRLRKRLANVSFKTVQLCII